MHINEIITSLKTERWTLASWCTMSGEETGASRCAGLVGTCSRAFRGLVHPICLLAIRWNREMKIACELHLNKGLSGAVSPL